MRFFLLIAIKIYWKVTPKSKRGSCIFRKSCSGFVFEQTSQNGFWSGIKAFGFRFENCRHGFTIFTNPMDGSLQLILPNNEVLDEELIALHVIAAYRKTNPKKMNSLNTTKIN